MSPFAWSLLVWGVLAAIVLAVELLAWRTDVPWSTLTWTIQQCFARFGQLAYLLFIGLIAVFVAHIVYRGRPRRDEEGD